MPLPAVPPYRRLQEKAMKVSDELQRTIGGIPEQALIRGPIELFRTMRDSHYLGRLDPHRPEKEAKTEETIRQILSPFID